MARPKREKKAERVNVYLTGTLLKSLDKYCENNHNVARSRVIEDALQEFLEREEKKK